METLQTRGIRPQTPYDLHTPWADYRMPSTGELSGRHVALTRDDGKTLELSFDGDTVAWRDPDDGSEHSGTYDAVAPRERVYFVDFLDEAENCWSIALNLRTNGAVVMRNMLVRHDGRTDLQQDLYPCVVAGSGGVAPELTDELVGKRAYAEYADGHAVEHVYFNPRRFVWQGLGAFVYSGSECDNSTTWKIDEKLYLLTWVEEWQAVGAGLLLDYEAMRNVGTLYGQDDKGFVHTLCGARLELLSEMDYPSSYEPSGMAEGATI
jgi:hypothetical protein